MGVKKLAKLFDGKKRASNGRGWVRKRIERSLVVDGNQFCQQISRKRDEQLQGSNYAYIFEHVTKIIKKLKRCGIEPCFIFDGVNKQEKLTTNYRKGKVDTRDPIPILGYTVCVNALREMDVKMYVADGEGDKTCAEVANFLNCPVLSTDSDFLLFDVTGGYVDLHYCLRERKFDSDSDVLEVEVYYRDEFVKHHFSRNKDLIFLYPAIAGNDIFPETGRRFLNGRRDWDAEEVDRWIMRHTSDTSPIDSLPRDVKKNFDDVKKYYNCINPVDPQQILCSPIPKCPKPVPEWLHLSYRSRGIPYMLFDALVNRTQHHGSSALSTRIRQVCYTIIGVPEVKEFRSSGEAKVSCFKPVPGHLSLGEIESGRDDERRRMFFYGLDCEKNAAMLAELSEGDMFILSTIIFWKSRTAPPDVLIKALLACFVRLSSMGERADIVRLCREQSASRTASSCPPLDDWQNVYKDALVLFLLLRYHVRAAPCPSIAFDQKIVLFLESNPMEIDQFVGEALCEKYRKMLEILGL